MLALTSLIPQSSIFDQTTCCMYVPRLFAYILIHVKSLRMRKIAGIPVLVHGIF